ncbi:metallophosphoesterase family protein [Tautonia plasticadhaerens]|uniref:Calcineurin-like phosphoesterase superfamily domain protein n=1 Tax=Tautonia plasticadhaerens TaxID=2527974 RepID=A0A518H0K9_9BACT|nr:metallophosphoesterase [Tautonia plasticadhaerens]QDV34374.1 Calcineurin-like phosphoesterase superfamily domain protein [Tautonia plasticadhaerens]
MTRTGHRGRLGRRAFLSEGVLLLGAATMSGRASAASPDSEDRPALRVGLITDLHYADKPPAGTRHYRETPSKLAEAAGLFRGESPEFLVELGDLIDAADSVEVELGYLDRIDRDFSAICPRRYYVLGNHCVDTLTKAEFLGRVGQERSFLSFDAGGWHFVVLDSCFRSDGEPYGRKNFEWTDPNIPEAEVDWLRDDLARAPSPVIVFAHQRLDVGSPYGVRNAPEVRRILEESGRVRAVFQGHSHANAYAEIGGISYVTLVAMVEGSGEQNSGYALVEAGPDGAIRVRGFRLQADYAWPG